MRAVAGGVTIPTVVHKKHEHTLTNRQEYLVCNRIRRNLKAQKHLYAELDRYRDGNNLRIATEKPQRGFKTSVCRWDKLSNLSTDVLAQSCIHLDKRTYVVTGRPFWRDCVPESPPGSTRCWLWSTAASYERGLQFSGGRTIKIQEEHQQF